jgi:type II secretory pathway pseudopilin PulG
VTFFIPFPFVALSGFSRLEAKQGHATSAKRDRFSASSFLKFRIPRVSASRNRGAHFAFPNKILPARPASAPRTLALALHHPISSANPKFKIKNRRVSPLIPSPLNPLIPRYCAAAFTLVELLAVIGIMGLLAAVGVPALKGLTGSGGRKQALSQLMGALEIARNTAISTGTNAAVIFPDSTFVSGEAYKYRSMAVVAWNPTNTNLPTTMVGSWIVLPQGVAFFPNSLKTANLPTATNISVRILTGTNKANFPAIIFQPDGGLSEDYSPLPTNGIAFFEGTVAGITTNPTSKMTNFETVRLTKYTGRTRPTLAPDPK